MMTKSLPVNTFALALVLPLIHKVYHIDNGRCLSWCAGSEVTNTVVLSCIHLLRYRGISLASFISRLRLHD